MLEAKFTDEEIAKEVAAKYTLPTDTLAIRNLSRKPS